MTMKNKWFTNFLETCNRRNIELNVSSHRTVINTQFGLVICLAFLKVVSLY